MQRWRIVCDESISPGENNIPVLDYNNSTLHDIALFPDTATYMYMYSESYTSNYTVILDFTWVILIYIEHLGHSEIQVLANSIQ